MKLSDIRQRYVEKKATPLEERCGNCSHLLDVHVHDNCGLCDSCDCVLMSAPYGHDYTKLWTVAPPKAAERPLHCEACGGTGKMGTGTPDSEGNEEWTACSECCGTGDRQIDHGEPPYPPGTPIAEWPELVYRHRACGATVHREDYPLKGTTEYVCAKHGTLPDKFASVECPKCPLCGCNAVMENRSDGEWWCSNCGACP